MIVLASCGNKPFMLVMPGQSKNSGNEPSPVVMQKQQGDSGRTFADWCREKASLSPEVKYNVEALLKVARTTECDAANQRLSSRTNLWLANNKISDLKPLESLTNLEKLALDNHKISDINNNKISDIKPLKSLINLTDLYLSNHLLSDIKPLESLSKLTELYLTG